MIWDLNLPDEKVPLLLPLASLKRNYEAASPVDVFLCQTQRHGFMAFLHSSDYMKGVRTAGPCPRWINFPWHPKMALPCASLDPACGTIPSPSWKLFLEKPSCLQRKLWYHPGWWHPAVLRKWPHSTVSPTTTCGLRGHGICLAREFTRSCLQLLDSKRC